MTLPGPERLLALTREPDEGLGDALDLFARFVLLHMAVRDTLRAIESGDPVRGVWALAFGACFAASFRAGWLRPALGVALALAVWKLVRIFPVNPNHFFLELVCLGFLALRDPASRRDAATVASGLRWIPVAALFWSGVNKLLYGTYFDGAFLASQIPNRSFAFAVGFVLPEAELARLLATRPPGPFFFEAWPALLLSNAIYLGEIAAGIALLIPRLRRLGVAASVLMLTGIEVGAREFLFGALMLNLLALFLGPRWSRGVFAASATAYVVLVPVRFFFPEWRFN